MWAFCISLDAMQAQVWLSGGLTLRTKGKTFWIYKKVLICEGKKLKSGKPTAQWSLISKEKDVQTKRKYHIYKIFVLEKPN